MPQAARPASRLDSGLRFLQSRGMRRGVRGDSRAWFWVFVVVWATRRVRRAVGSEPSIVYRDELQPGQTIEIGHLTETYADKRLRRG
jgi:hypothetical protein